MIEGDFSGMLLVLSLFDEIDCLTEFVLYHFFTELTNIQFMRRCMES